MSASVENVRVWEPQRPSRNGTRVRPSVAAISVDKYQPAFEARSGNAAPEYGALKDGALKEQFKDCLRRRSATTDSLPALTLASVRRGVSRATLARWGRECGLSKSYVSRLLSRIFVKLGLRRRRKGGGRRVSPGARELLALARRRYGRSFRSVLHSACRLANATHSRQPLAGGGASYSSTTIRKGAGGGTGPSVLRDSAVTQAHLGKRTNSAALRQPDLVGPHSRTWIMADTIAGGRARMGRPSPGRAVPGA